MAITITAGFGHDLVELAEDLEAVEHGLSRLLEEIIGKEARPVLAEMRGLLPFDPAHRGWRGDHKRRDPGHIRDSLRIALDKRRGAVVMTTHPGGPVHWWGGVISPRHAEIEIRQAPGAGEDFISREADKVGRDLEDAVERFLQARGL